MALTSIYFSISSCNSIGILNFPSHGGCEVKIITFYVLKYYNKHYQEKKIHKNKSGNLRVKAEAEQPAGVAGAD